MAGYVSAFDKSIRVWFGMAIYMGGGSSLMYAAEAMQAFEEFTTS